MAYTNPSTSIQFPLFCSKLHEPTLLPRKKLEIEIGLFLLEQETDFFQGLSTAVVLVIAVIIDV